MGDRDAKIEEILDLVPVPQGDREPSRATLRALSDGRLDLYISRLSVRAARLAEWRKTRATPAEAGTATETAS